jgi:gluconate 2-dehydrogenase gamma chain
MTPQETPSYLTSPNPDEGAARQAVRRVSRRRFLVVSAASGATAALSTSAAQAQQAPTAPAGNDPHAGHGAPMQLQLQQGAPMATPAMEQAVAPLAGFIYFSPFQAEIVNAAAGRIIPNDQNGPGASEAGVVYFIDRQLSASFGFNGRRYANGPFTVGTPTQGDQSGMDMRDRYRLGIQGMEDYAQQLYQMGFAKLTPEDQDRILTDMEAGIPTTFDGSSIQAATTEPSGGGTEGMHKMSPGNPGVGASAFFQLLRSHVIAGFFVDPVYGGNQNMVGWKLIGFPGAHVSYTGSISKYGVPFDGPYTSLAAYQGQYTQGS